MKFFKTLAVTAGLVLAILPRGLTGEAQVLAESASSCPTLDITAIWPRSLAVWLLLGSDKPVTTPTTIQLTTEREIATYSLPAITFAAPVGGTLGGFRSAPIALVAPLGNVLSVTVRPVTATATCPNATRIARLADASGVYNLAQGSDDDIAFEKTVAIEALLPDKTIAVTTRGTAAPFDCKVAHRYVSSVQPVQPEYPLRARESGQVGTVQIKVSLSATGAVRSTSVYRSSGYEDLDQAALAAAKASTYAPEVVNCFPVDGSYLFRADFRGVKEPVR